MKAIRNPKEPRPGKKVVRKSLFGSIGERRDAKRTWSPWDASTGDVTSPHGHVANDDDEDPAVGRRTF